YISIASGVRSPINIRPSRPARSSDQYFFYNFKAAEWRWKRRRSSDGEVTSDRYSVAVAKEIRRGGCQRQSSDSSAGALTRRSE
ncbi:hypothetical protein LINGRAHAP2_LOCUS2109, partial [Linum grandiflorum]